MKKSRKYIALTALGLFAAVVTMTVMSRIYVTDFVPYVPTRTSEAELTQLANFTRIHLEGDYAVEVTQVQDYSIEYSPLSESQGEFAARVENDTLFISGFGNRTDTDRAIVRIGVPVLDTLEASYLEEITISDFRAPLMNVRVIGFQTFTMRNNVLDNIDLFSQGNGAINLQGNTFTMQNFHIEGESDLNITE
ncbi:MAG: DUF2807 domain-containing protein [Pseudomonadota bacterium]